MNKAFWNFTWILTAFFCGCIVVNLGIYWKETHHKHHYASVIHHHVAITRIQE